MPAGVCPRPSLALCAHLYSSVSLSPMIGPVAVRIFHPSLLKTFSPLPGMLVSKLSR